MVVLVTVAGGEQWTLPLELSASRLQRLEENSNRIRRMSTPADSEGRSAAENQQTAIDLGGSDDGLELRPGVDLLGIRMQDMQAAAEARQSQQEAFDRDDGDGDRGS